MLPVSQRKSWKRPRDAFPVDPDIQVPLGNGEVERRAAFQMRYQTGEELAIHGVEFKEFSAVNSLTGQLPHDLARLLVGVHRNPRRGFTRLVESRRIGGPHLNPGLDRPGEIANRERAARRARSAQREKAIPSRYSRQYASTRVSRYSSVSEGWRATLSASVSYTPRSTSASWISKL